MRRIVVAAVVCFALVAVAGAVTMVPPSQDKPAQQVEVTNFPAVQSVTGSVSVDNLPAVQTVGGAVSVSNLPLDDNGNVKVSGVGAPGAQQIRFVGFTTTTYVWAGLNLLAMSRDCDAQFSGARLCEGVEVLHSIPPAPDWTSPVAAWVFNPSSPTTALGACVFYTGEIGYCGSSGGGIDRGSLSAACCGF